MQAAAGAKSHQSCLTLCDPIDGSPPGSPVPGILQARTGVGCHFLLQSMKVKSESEVAQSCPILRDPMDCSLPDSSVHGILQARVLEWVASAFSFIQATQVQFLDKELRSPFRTGCCCLSEITTSSVSLFLPDCFRLCPNMFWFVC